MLYKALAGGEKDRGLSLLKSDLAHICRRLNLKWTLKPTSKWRLLELVSNLNYRTKLSNISASGTTKELRYITNMKVTCLVICQAWENCLLVISQNINSNNCYHIVVCTSEYMYIKSIKAKKKRQYNVICDAMSTYIVHYYLSASLDTLLAIYHTAAFSFLFLMISY